MTSFERIKDMLNVESVKQDITWVITGDSITHGAFHLFGWRDYVQLFEERIRFEMWRYYDVVIRTAISGWRTDLVLGDIDRRILRYKPNVLSIMLGMNDCVPANNISPKQFRDNYNNILNQAEQSSQPALILHTPNLITSEAMDARSRLGQYADIIRDIADKRQAVLVDHYAAWEKACDNGLNFEMWMNDSIHPNHFGHIAFAHEMFKLLGIFDKTSNVCRMYKP